MADDQKRQVLVEEQSILLPSKIIFQLQGDEISFQEPFLIEQFLNLVTIHNIKFNDANYVSLFYYFTISSRQHFNTS